MFVVLATLIVAAFGYAGVQYWNSYEVKQDLRSSTKAISIRLEKILADAAGASNITYVEFFETSAEAIKAIDSEVFEIRAAAIRSKFVKTEPIEKYASDSLALIRSAQAATRAQLSFNTASKSADLALEEMKTTSSVANKYRWESLMTSATSAVKDMEEASKKIVAASRDTIEAVAAVSSSSKLAGDMLGTEVLPSAVALENTKAWAEQKIASNTPKKN